MSDLDKLARLADLFTQIRDILIQENENNWIRGINPILNQINYSLENNEKIKDTIKSIGIVTALQKSYDLDEYHKTI